MNPTFESGPTRGTGRRRASSPEGQEGLGRAWTSGLYLRSLRRWWWIPLVTAAVCAGAAMAFTARETPRYTATATALVAPVAEIEEASDVLRSLDTLERRTVVATFARIAGTEEVRRAAAEQLGLEAGAVSGHRVTASVVSSTNLIRIRAEGPSPYIAAALANAASRVTEAEARRLYRIFTLHVVEVATPPQRPVHPDPQRNVGVGLVLGLFLGMLTVVGFEGVRGPRATDPGLSAAA